MSVSFDPAIWLNPHTSTISRITRVMCCFSLSFLLRLSILYHHFHHMRLFSGWCRLPRSKIRCFAVHRLENLPFQAALRHLDANQRIHEFFRGFVRFQVGETWRFRDRLELRSSKITQNPKVKLLTLMTWKCQISTSKGKKIHIIYIIYIYICSTYQQLFLLCFPQISSSFHPTCASAGGFFKSFGASVRSTV